MRNRLLPLLLFPVLGSVLASCSQDIPLVDVGIEDVHQLPRMKPYTFKPVYSGESYRWTMKTPSGADSLLATTREYTFLHHEEGSYTLRFEIIDPASPFSKELKVAVVHEEVEYSPYLKHVYEYRPAPGQFVNILPEYKAGDTEEDMRRKVEECLSDTVDEMVSLGSFGGYITFGFDHTVVNVPGQKDFMILGNSFYDGAQSGRKGGSAEPGIVMVAFDRNGNGLPDPDEWYELAGSEYQNPATLKSYEITYFRPDADKKPVPALGFIDTQYIPWKDNRGGTGYIAMNADHTQDYFPKWLKEDQLTFSGTRLPDNGVYQPASFTYLLNAYAWGYVDNQPNEQRDLNSFDIAWAVDKDGTPVHLPGVDFIRVYTGVNQSCGWLGEVSTEIVRAQDLHLKK